MRVTFPLRPTASGTLNVPLPDDRSRVRVVRADGCRREPYGIRARISRDDGGTWEPEIVLRDDGPTGDLGYPRSVERPDGQVVTAYYFNGPKDDDRAIEATIWEP